MLIVVFVSVVAASGLTWWLGTKVRSPEQAAADARAPKASPITAPVEFRELSKSLVTRGHVRVTRERPVEFESPDVEGRPLVTNVPLRAGQTAREGMVAVEVAQRPVFLLRGKRPMFRNLTVGAEGRDVSQLQTALGRLGYGSNDRPGHFGQSTAAAVKRFYHARGYAPSPSDPGAGKAGTGSASSSPSPSPGGPGKGGDPQVGMSEVLFLDDLPARVVKVSARLGKKADGTLLSLTDGGPVVEADLTEEEAAKMEQGTRATVDFEGMDRRFTGEVVSVRRRAKDKDGTRFAARVSGGGGELPLSLRDEEVKVTFTLSGTKEKVRVVPMAAVWAHGDGSTYVETLAKDGTRHRIKVELGMSGDGFVELAAPADEPREGDLVLVGEGRS
ncbi:peptidoglycan-binding protein [Actinomadura litoris]|uniref:peptidoglycan-binding protein n=1 Tax=Actinomadura litoris TaxID=2678616 RepID=UPI001FA728FA|nr:peptidoglycan-binding protein [Actinomadura litoris]